MPTDETGWPMKLREIHDNRMDSTIRNEFRFRDGDIVIATHAKSGTTWTQQIIGQPIFGGDPEVPVAELSPRLDLRIPGKAEKPAA
jgi:aryl sulfotransferase